MKSLKIINEWAIACVFAIVGTATASTDSIGPNGINSAGLTNFNGQPLTGAGIVIGQMEPFRPGKPIADGGFDDAMNSNSTTVPTRLFIQDAEVMAMDANMFIIDHTMQVAGVLISNHPTRTGVAPGALLYSAGATPAFPGQPDESLTAQNLLLEAQGNMRALNMSFGDILVDNHILDGNSLFTLFID